MELKVGMVLNLERTDSEKVEAFRCKIVEIQEDAIHIDYPVNIETNRTAFLIDGTHFRAYFYTENKVNYSFHTEVLGRERGNIPTIKLSLPPPQEFTKIQRRQYFRLETAVDVAVTFHDRHYQFVTIDISAGGLALNLTKDVEFQENDIVQLTLVLPFENGNIKYVRTNAKVIRILQKGKTTLASLNFDEIEEHNKQHVVRFCFERQRMLLKKEATI